MAIPAGDANYPIAGSFTVPYDAHATAVVPHMHWLGKDFTLVSVPSLVREEALIGTGMFPAHREETYSIPADDLYQHPLFEGVSKQFLKWNEGSVVRRHFRKGQIICREGAFGSTAFIIEKGQVEIFIQSPIKHAKLMYNAAISPLAAAAGIDNGQLLSVPAARALFFALLQENHRILRAAGVALGKVGPFRPSTVAYQQSFAFRYHDTSLCRAIAGPPPAFAIRCPVHPGRAGKPRNPAATCTASCW